MPLAIARQKEGLRSRVAVEVEVFCVTGAVICGDLNRLSMLAAKAIQAAASRNEP